MYNISMHGYLPGYSGLFSHTFTKQFHKKVSLSCDSIDFDPTADFKVLIQCEPPELYNIFAGMVHSVQHNFDLILTYDPRLLSLPQAVEFCPVGTWVKDVTLNKTDQVSFLMSSKILTSAHRMRFMILRKFGHMKRIGGFDFMMHRNPPEAPNKEIFFEQAKFHIACENSIIPNMYTEKILDCFKTKTVPLYYGCQNIEKYFNPQGIIRFNSIDELERIIYRLTPQVYDQMIPHIEDNYERARPYWEKTIHQRIEDIVDQHLQMKFPI